MVLYVCLKKLSSGKVSIFCEIMQALFAACFMLVSCLAYSSSLKMEATCSTKILVDFEQASWHCIQVDRNLHNNCCENLKYHIFPVYMIRDMTVSMTFLPFKNIICFNNVVHSLYLSNILLLI
jgi:hypothetical protein